jgi:hypothetical protein
VQKHSIAGMRLFTAIFIGAVIGGAALLAQTAQDPQQRLAPKEIKWPGSRTGGWHCRGGGDPDGRPEGRSQTAGPLHAAVRYTHVGYKQTRQTAEALSHALE